MSEEVVLEAVDIQEEVEVKTQPPARKRRARQSQIEIEREQPPAKKRLLKKDIDAICKGLLQIKPEEILPKIIASVEADVTHLQAFPEREKLWRHVRESTALCDLIRQLVFGYVNLYKTHSKGKDKYAHFLVSWHELLSRFAVEANGPEDAIWCALVSSARGCSSDAEDRSAIVTGIAKAVYEQLTEMASQFQRQRRGQTHSESMYPQAKESAPDDDASVIRVSGFALHSAISFRRRALLPKFKSKHSSEARRKFKRELELLQHMKASDKSFVPQVVLFQDRGRLTIMHPAMLNFGRSLFSTVRSSLNYTSYQKSGSEVFKCTHECVLESKELLQRFKLGLEKVTHSTTQGPASGIEDGILMNVYTTLVTKMLHTINNDFLKNLSLLDKIATGKGTDAKLLLRDKLKATAVDTHSHIPKI